MKQKTLFYCTECGNEMPKWAGRCPACGAWNTIVEQPPEKTASKGSRARPAAPGGVRRACPVTELTSDEEIRFPRGGSMESQEAGWAMHWIWAGESPDDLRHELVEAVFSVWEEKERPFLAGK